MDKQELLRRLEKLAEEKPDRGYVVRDTRHQNVDDLLMQFINDEDIRRAAQFADTWYDR